MRSSVISLKAGSDVPQAVTAATATTLQSLSGNLQQIQSGEGNVEYRGFPLMVINMTCVGSLAEQGACSRAGSLLLSALSRDQRNVSNGKNVRVSARLHNTTARSDSSPNLCTHHTQEHFSRADASPEHCLTSSSLPPFHLTTFSN